MGKKIFIGSSSEAEKYIQEIEILFDKEQDFEIIRWNDPEIFSLNNVSLLDSLIKQSYLVDFAIFLATKDDLNISRGIKQKSPRDNIIFEFGLFLNSLGKERCFLVTEKDCKILSDMTGITLIRFTENNFKEEVTKLITNLKQKKKHIPSLITTGLAYGYYKNYLKKLSEESAVKSIYIYLNKPEIDLSKLEKITSLNVRESYCDKNDESSFYDYPTTLDVINDVVNDKNELSEHEKDIYIKRELDNFKIVLKRLMEKENFKDKIKFNNDK